MQQKERLLEFKEQTIDDLKQDLMDRDTVILEKDDEIG